MELPRAVAKGREPDLKRSKGYRKWTATVYFHGID